MDKSMRDRLMTSEKRLNEIDDLLLQPDTSSDMNLFKKLSKERSQLEPIVNKYHDFVYAEQNKNDALLMCNDKDAEIAQMGKEELKRKKRRDALAPWRVLGDVLVQEIRQKFLVIPRLKYDIM